MSDYEDAFDREDRKHFRKERKRFVQKDRSKFKKSDQDQLKKRMQEEKVPDHLQRGRILAIAPEGIIVDSAGTRYQCTLKGALKQEKSRMKNLVAVGDFVHFEKKNEREGTIAFIEERRSVLSRADNLQRMKEQLIAVNIDLVLITSSVVLPPFKPSLVDRYIIAAQKGRMEPIVVINKIDLLNHPPAGALASFIEEERALFDHFVTVYRSLGFKVLAVSTESGEGMDTLKEVMQGKTSVFSGQSGVGKSSLINAVTGASLNVGEIVAKTSKGAHTTSSTHLLMIEGGGFCIDTPGIKSFGLWDLSKEDLLVYFHEIFDKGQACKYPDCLHQGEPGCVVPQAVETGEISPLRFDSYLALMASLKEKHRLR